MTDGCGDKAEGCAAGSATAPQKQNALRKIVVTATNAPVSGPSSAKASGRPKHTAQGRIRDRHCTAGQTVTLITDTVFPPTQPARIGTRPQLQTEQGA